jgi:hypothetical protein
LTQQKNNKGGDDMGVKEWKELFQAIGLSEADMEKWHALFEERYPKDHERFLTWLGLDKKTIAIIRKR